MKNILSILYLFFTYCAAAQSPESALKQAQNYTELLNVYTPQTADESYPNIHKLFGGHQPLHVDDVKLNCPIIKNKPNWAELGCYIDGLAEKFKNKDILNFHCTILTNEISSAKCYKKKLYYFIPIQKEITFSKNKKKQIKEILLIQAASSKIEQVLPTGESPPCEIAVQEDLELPKDNALANAAAQRLYDKAAYNAAAEIYEQSVAKNPADATAQQMLQKIADKGISVEDEIAIAQQKARSGNLSKMKAAFNTIYLYQDHPKVLNDPCLFLFMANMLEHYLGDDLTEEHKARCVAIYVAKACYQKCPNVQEFLESLPKLYRLKHYIHCNY
jgi:hypothetical protein